MLLNNQGPTVGTVALLVDIENLRHVLTYRHRLTFAPADVMALARSYGTVVEAQGFRGWYKVEGRDGGLEQATIAAGITLVNARVNDDRKSSADMVLTCAAYKLAATRPEIDTYVIASGDSDFEPLVHALRTDYGKKVIILAVPGGVATTLLNAANEAAFLQTSRPSMTDRAMTGRDRRIMKQILLIDERWRDRRFKFVVNALMEPKFFGAPKLTYQEACDFLNDLLSAGVLASEREEYEGRTPYMLRVNKHHLWLGDMMTRWQDRPKSPCMAAVA